MPSIKLHLRNPSFSNSAPGLPQSSGAFRHALSHSTLELASALRRGEQTATFGLNDTNSASGVVPNTLLERVATLSRKALQKAWHQQCTSRRALANQRMTLVKDLQSPIENTSLLQAFKVEPAVLPEPTTIGSGDCCSDAPKKPFSECEHEEGGGVVIDLDEAAHGAFASSKYLGEVAQGRPEVVVESFKSDAAMLSTQPVRYLGKELTEGGVAEFSTAVGAGAIMLPLAALAVKAGIEEWQHGSHELKMLKATRADQLEELKRLRDSEKALPSMELKPLIQAQAVRLEKTEEATQQAHKNREIGAMSAASGLTIGLKALTDIGLKVSLGIKGVFTGKGFFALSESAQTGTAAAGAAVGFGLAGTFILGPLAGLFATALGAFFTIKTVTKLRQLKNDFQHLRADLKNDSLQRTVPVDAATEALGNFLIRQGDKRIGFFKRFARWNKAFMVGSGLYAASAVTKAVVVGVAAAGVIAAASNPIGLAVITAVGIVGAIAMGIASFSFLRGHGKQSKYSQATAAEHGWVDRKLMTDLHGLYARGEKHSGFDMAASCLKYLDAQKLLLRNFLNEAARAAGKHSPMEKNLSWWKHLSKQVADDKAVRRFLKTERGTQHFRTLVKETLLAKNEMLVKKLQHRQRVLQRFQSNDLTQTGVQNIEKPFDRSALHELNQLGETWAKLDSEYGADQAELELNLLRLKQIESEPGLDFEKLATFIDAGANVKEIGKFLHQDLDREIRHARGVLFESQLEGARLREQQFRALRLE